MLERAPTSELDALRGQVEELTARVIALEKGLGGTIEPLLLLPLDLTVIEAQLLALLMKRRIVSYESAFAVLYGTRATDDLPSASVLKVHICKLRRKLPAGVIIYTYHAGNLLCADGGYRLEGAKIIVAALARAHHHQPIDSKGFDPHVRPPRRRRFARQRA
jgi:Transcriptional regulatory protein, C terminal